MYVCAYIDTYIFIYIYIYVYTHICYKYIKAYSYMYVHTSICTVYTVNAVSLQVISLIRALWLLLRKDTCNARHLTGCHIFMGHFPQKSPIISGFFAGNDMQLKAFYAYSLTVYLKTRVLHKHVYTSTQTGATEGSETYRFLEFWCLTSSLRFRVPQRFRDPNRTSVSQNELIGLESQNEA